MHLQQRHEELLSLWQPALSAEAVQKLDLKRYLTASLVLTLALLLLLLLYTSGSWLWYLVCCIHSADVQHLAYSHSHSVKMPKMLSEESVNGQPLKKTTTLEPQVNFTPSMKLCGG